jgi:hypothetical protein
MTHYKTRIENPSVFKLSRHTGRDCRYPVHRDVMMATIPGFWVPAIPAGTTRFFLNLTGIAVNLALSEI